MHAMTNAPCTDSEIEAGRKLFTGDWQFIWAAPSVEIAAADGTALEIAFAGRSNVGKSSLINALTGRNALARTSHTPGRTQELIFFEGPMADGLRLVDMPGYGYAAAAKAKIAAWTALIHDYLRGRANLARVYVLIDARHGLKDADLEVLKTLDRGGGELPDRADQGRPGEGGELHDASRDRSSSSPATGRVSRVLATSSRSGAGMTELRAAIAQLLAERS